jgi:O-antigen/teichoic acid export membrane protein
MAAGLVPTALTEVLVAAVARRRIGAQILAREGVVTLSMAAAAVGFHQAGMGAAGLPAAFGASRLAGLATALVLCRGVFPRGGGGATAVRLPRQLRRYAGPVWLAEVANSALLRMDVMLLTVMVDAGTVGVYAAVMQVANSLRSVRRSFDPIVTAIFSEIGAAHSPRRLAAGFSRATSLVLATQLPIFAVLAAAIPWIMRALGPGFADGADAALVLCAFWMVNGVLGLSGVIVTGYGHSGLALANVLATLVVQSALLTWLVPHHGLMGAVVAVGASQAILNLAQLAEASVLTRTRFYGPEVLWTAGLGAVAGATMVAGWAIAAGSGPIASRMVGLFLFAAVFAPGLVWLHRALGCGGGATLR